MYAATVTNRLLVLATPRPAVNEAGTPGGVDHDRGAGTVGRARGRRRRRRWSSDRAPSPRPASTRAARRSAAGSTTVTSSTPSARSARNDPIPIGPPPKTTAATPGRGSCAEDRAVGDGHRLDQGAEHRPDFLRKSVGHAFTHDRELRQTAARTPQPVTEHLPAEVVVAGLTWGAGAARPQRLHRYQVADGNPRDVASHLDDLTRELVTDDGRQRRGAHRPDEVLVEIGAAQTVVQRPDLDVTGTGIRFGHVLEPNVAGTVVKGCTHDRRSPGNSRC